MIETKFVIEGIYAVAKIINDQVQFVKANKAQLMRLAARIQVIESAVKELEALPEKEQYTAGLNHLLQTLRQCLAFIKKFSTSSRWARWILKAGNYQETFEALNEQLSQSMQQLSLGLIVQQVLDREADKEDQAKDAAFIQENRALIVDLNLKELQALQNIYLNQREQAEVLNLQMAAIQSQLRSMKQTNKALIQDKHRIPYYDLLFKQLLSEGSLAKIYLGEWEGQAVAIKCLSGNLNAKEQEQFIREVKVMSRLRHPNITSFYGACLEKGHACLVMEYMEESSLDKFISSKSLSMEQQKSLSLDLAKGLAYLHSRQILHRDLKSAHILVNAKGIAKLADFGLSKIEALSVKTAVECRRSLAWQAPECFKFNTIYTEASDIYSLGVIFWEIMTGMAPIFDESRLSDYGTLGERQRIPADIALEWQKLIKQCWSLEPAERPNAKSVIQQLEVESNLFSAEQYYKQGQIFERQKDFVAAIQHYRKSVNQGYFKAKTNLGMLYLMAPNVVMPQDKSRAFQYFLEAADQGHVRAMFNAAAMLEYGDGIVQDTVEALKWYQKICLMEPDNKEVVRKCEKLEKYLSNQHYQLQSHLSSQGR